MSFGKYVTGIRVTPDASATDDLLQLQSATGTTLVRVNVSGVLTAPNVVVSNGASSNVPLLGAANAFTVGGQTITNNSDVIALQLKANATQTNRVFSIVDSGNTVRFSVSNGGGITTSEALYSTASGRAYLQPNFDTNGMGIVTAAAANKGLVVRAAASQTANLQEWQDSAANILMNVRSDGGLSIRRGIGMRIYNAADNAFATVDFDGTYFRSNYAGMFGAAISPATSGALVASSTAAAQLGLIIRGAASQTANLQEWQNSAGTVVAKVDSSGYIHFSELRGLSGTVYIRDSSTNTAIQIGTDVRFPRRNLITTNDALALSVQGTTNCLPDTATRIGLIVKGAASQSANLQEWQNSSGTILARVSSAGLIVSTDGIYSVGAVTAGDGLAVVSAISSGGAVTLTRATSTPTNPGSNIGRLYFRDGTNAGTLKLVVRAGSAGAETTILDNIPQT